MASGFLRLRQPRELLAVAQQSIPSNGSPSVTRDTPPTNTTTSTPGCVMWIHLQTSISTEWQQSSMVTFNTKSEICLKLGCKTERPERHKQKGAFAG